MELFHKVSISLVLCALVLFSPLSLFAYLNAERSVHVIDVGYGTSIHIKSETGNYLFDTGPREAAPSLVRHLAEDGVAHIDALFLTHTHPDHAGNVLYLTRLFSINHVFWNDLLPEDEAEVTALEEVFQKVSTHILQPGDSLRIEKDLSLFVLKASTATLNLNDRSLSFLMKWGKARLLFMTDPSPAFQKELASLNKDLLMKTRVSFLLWPHHGDVLDPSLSALLGKVPVCAVSVGPNEYGMPSPEFIQQSSHSCGEIFVTERTGDIRLHIKGKKVLPVSTFE